MAYKKLINSQLCHTTANNIKKIHIQKTSMAYSSILNIALSTLKEV